MSRKAVGITKKDAEIEEYRLEHLQIQHPKNLPLHATSTLARYCICSAVHRNVIS